MAVCVRCGIRVSAYVLLNHARFCKLSHQVIVTGRRRVKDVDAGGRGPRTSPRSRLSCAVRSRDSWTCPTRTNSEKNSTGCRLNSTHAVSLIRTTLIPVLVSWLIYFNVKIAGSRRLGLHPETGFSSICSGTRTIQCTDRHNRPFINISADTWTVQLRFPDEFAVIYIFSRIIYIFFIIIDI